MHASQLIPQALRVYLASLLTNRCSNRYLDRSRHLPKRQVAWALSNGDLPSHRGLSVRASSNRFASTKNVGFHPGCGQAAVSVPVVRCWMMLVWQVLAVCADFGAQGPQAHRMG